jgi:hypothetical protein
MHAYDPHADAQVHEDNENLLASGSGVGSKGTYMVNGKEQKKRSKKKRNQNLNEEKTKADPISQLGFGIVAYIGMLYYMIWAFCLYSFLLWPVFHFYNDGKAFD